MNQKLKYSILAADLLWIAAAFEAAQTIQSRPDPGQGRIAASPICAGRSSSSFDLDASVLQRKIGRASAAGDGSRPSLLR